MFRRQTKKGVASKREDVPEPRSGAQPAVPRHAGQQELHLVGQDAAPAQDHVFVQAGHVGQVQQRHACFLGQAAALVAVAGAAGGDAVHPGIVPAARGRDDVLARQVVGVEMAATVGAHMAVAHEQLRVRQRRALPPGTARDRPAYRDDRVHLDARLQAGAPLHAAAQHVERVAQRPGDAVAGVQHGSFLGRKPGLRPSRHIELQNFQDPYSYRSSITNPCDTPDIRMPARLPSLPWASQCDGPARPDRPAARAAARTLSIPSESRSRFMQNEFHCSQEPPWPTTRPRCATCNSCCTSC